jgi:hypothetical protein
MIVVCGWLINSLRFPYIMKKKKRKHVRSLANGKKFECNPLRTQQMAFELVEEVGWPVGAKSSRTTSVHFPLKLES